MGRPTVKLSEVLPPLIFGTATFHYQFNPDPFALGPNELVQRALAQGVRAFDTSPYYGPAEEILGTAFTTDLVRQHYSRDEYYILTKVGRVLADHFDYSAKWVRHSVRRSCKQLRTDYVDVVYCHDVEFVTPAEVLTAVRELRRLRDEEGIVKYIGICGYTVSVLCDLAELVVHETGEPLDIVQSYGNFTLQNSRLLTQGLPRFVAAKVDVVTNASPLGMGLLRAQGVPVGTLGDWHPAPPELRQACADASKWAASQNEKLEVVAVRYALENWLREAAAVGTYGDPLGRKGEPSSSSNSSSSPSVSFTGKLGVSVMGVSKLEELDETMRVWRSVLDGRADDLDDLPGTLTPSDAVSDQEWSLRRRRRIRVLAKHIQAILGSWIDYAWPSPEPGWVNRTPASTDMDVEEKDAAIAQGLPPMLTPPSDAEVDHALPEIPEVEKV